MIRPPPRSTLFPDTTRFRSRAISGRANEAKEVLASIARTNGRPAAEEDFGANQREEGTSVGKLWMPSLRRSTLMLWIAWFCISLAYYGIFTWLQIGRAHV